MSEKKYIRTFIQTLRQEPGNDSTGVDSFYDVHFMTSEDELYFVDADPGYKTLREQASEHMIGGEVECDGPTF
jgi:hypothetical protein